MKKYVSFILAVLILLSLCACGTAKPVETLPAEPVLQPDMPAETDTAPAEVTVTDMIGREVVIVPGSYKRVVCIGAGALRMYSYIGDVALLAGVEDIDNTTLENRPRCSTPLPAPICWPTVIRSAHCPPAVWAVPWRNRQKLKRFFPATPTL